MLYHFWKRWKYEYLLELQDIHRFHKQGSVGQKIAEGDTVIVHSKSCKRGFWNLVIIKELIRGHNGHARAAIIHISTGGGKIKHLRRPVERLFPLETNKIDVSAVSNHALSNQLESVNSDSNECETVTSKENVELPVENPTNNSSDDMEETGTPLLSQSSHKRNKKVSHFRTKSNSSDCHHGKGSYTGTVHLLEERYLHNNYTSILY